MAYPDVSEYESDGNDTAADEQVEDANADNVGTESPRRKSVAGPEAAGPTPPVPTGDTTEANGSVTK